MFQFAANSCTRRGLMYGTVEAHYSLQNKKYICPPKSLSQCSRGVQHWGKTRTYHKLQYLQDGTRSSFVLKYTSQLFLQDQLFCKSANTPKCFLYTIPLRMEFVGPTVSLAFISYLSPAASISCFANAVWVMWFLLSCCMALVVSANRGNWYFLFLFIFSNFLLVLKLPVKCYFKINKQGLFLEIIPWLVMIIHRPCYEQFYVGTILKLNHTVSPHIERHIYSEWEAHACERRGCKHLRCPSQLSCIACLSFINSSTLLFAC